MDYEFYRFIWWLLIGILFIGFAITDGFDMGVGALLKVIGRNDEERDVRHAQIVHPLLVRVLLAL